MSSPERRCLADRVVRVPDLLPHSHWVMQGAQLPCMSMHYKEEKQKNLCRSRNFAYKQTEAHDRIYDRARSVPLHDRNQRVASWLQACNNTKDPFLICLPKALVIYDQVSPPSTVPQDQPHVMFAHGERSMPRLRFGGCGHVDQRSPCSTLACPVSLARSRRLPGMR